MVKLWQVVVTGLLLSILLTARSAGEPAAAMPSPETPVSNNSSPAEPGAADIRSQYQEWAAAATAEVEANFGALNHVATNHDGQRYFETGECSDQELSGYYASSVGRSTTSDQLADLAHRMARYRISLSRGGYPPALWEEPVRRYEAASLDHIARFPEGRTAEESESQGDDDDGPGYYSLAEEIEAARAASAPTLPPLRNESECGSGEIMIVWRSDPPGARIWTIRRLYWEHCNRVSGNGYDLNRCRGWSEAQPHQGVSVYGNYVSLAQWPDGQRGTSMHTFVSNSDESGLIVRVRPTIRGP